MVRLCRIAGLRAADSRPYGAWVCPFCRGGRLDRPAVRWCFSGFARASRHREGFTAREGTSTAPTADRNIFASCYDCTLTRVCGPMRVYALRVHRPLRRMERSAHCGNKKAPSSEGALLEAPPGLEPGVRDLQSRALPLGYGAIYRICGRGSVRKSFVGAAYEARTRYLHLGKVALYRMS